MSSMSLFVCESNENTISLCRTELSFYYSVLLVIKHLIVSDVSLMTFADIQ